MRRAMNVRFWWGGGGRGGQQLAAVPPPGARMVGGQNPRNATRPLSGNFLGVIFPALIIPPRAIRSKQDCSFALLITSSRCSKGMLDNGHLRAHIRNFSFHSLALLPHDGSLDCRPGKSLIDASWITFGSYDKCFCLIYVSNVNSHNTIWLVL